LFLGCWWPKMSVPPIRKLHPFPRTKRKVLMNRHGGQTRKTALVKKKIVFCNQWRKRWGKEQSRRRPARNWVTTSWKVLTTNLTRILKLTRIDNIVLLYIGWASNLWQPSAPMREKSLNGLMFVTFERDEDGNNWTKTNAHSTWWSCRFWQRKD
jgi:hypothetical protein